MPRDSRDSGLRCRTVLEFVVSRALVNRFHHTKSLRHGRQNLLRAEDRFLLSELSVADVQEKKTISPQRFVARMVLVSTRARDACDNRDACDTDNTVTMSWAVRRAGCPPCVPTGRGE